MKDYHVVLSVAEKGGQLNHRPLVQYWRIRYAIGSSTIRSVTLTMPRIDENGTFYQSSPIQMNVDSYSNGYGFSNADINRWLKSKKWNGGTLLLFRVSFKNNHLDYKLLGRVDQKI